MHISRPEEAINAEHLSENDFTQMFHTLAERTKKLERQGVDTHNDTITGVLTITCTEQAEGVLEIVCERNEPVLTHILGLIQGTLDGSAGNGIKELSRKVLLLGSVLNTAISKVPNAFERLTLELSSISVKNLFRNIYIPKRLVLFALATTLLAPSFTGCRAIVIPQTQPLIAPRPFPAIAIPKAGPIPAIVDPAIAIPIPLESERVDPYYRIKEKDLGNEKKPCDEQHREITEDGLKALYTVRDRLLTLSCGPTSNSIDLLHDDSYTNAFLFTAQILREQTNEGSDTRYCYANIPDDLLDEIRDQFRRCAEQGWPSTLNGGLIQ